MLVELACDFAATGGAVYELGHAVSELLPALHAKLAADVELVSADESEDRLRSARASVPSGTRRVRFIRAELERGILMRDASVAIMVGTLQQTHPLQHSPLMAGVYRGLRPGGCVLSVELSRSRDSLLNNLFASHARDRERTGSCNTSEAMQGASTLNEKYALLADFRSVEIFYKQYGLSGLVAIK